MTTRNEIAEILGTTEKNLNARLIGLKIAPVCGRCGGCGRYSFNGDHSICYGCGGKGYLAPSEHDLPAIFDEAKACASDGRLATYLHYLRASRTVKAALDRVMAAWKATGISTAYDWRRSYGSDANPRDRDVAAINAKMADAYKRVEKTVYALKPSAPTYTADVVAAEKVVEAALADIEAARLELIEYEAAH